MPKLHPEMVEILAMIERDMAGMPKIHETTPVQARQMFEDAAPFWNEGGPEVPWTALEIPGPHGPIPARHYNPGAPAGSPCLIFIHGGGWVIGSSRMYDGVCRRLAHYAEVPVISLDYRLAPEHKFPVPLEDCLAAVRWIAGHGAALGIDGSRLAVAGDSAGGNLSLAVAMGLRDEGEPKLRGAALIYGAFGTDPDTESYRSYGTDQYLLSRADMIWFWNHYIRSEADKRDPRAVPLLGRFENLPPLFVSGAEFDPLLDDSRELVALLKAAGAPHDWAFWPGVVHGCIDMARMLKPAEGFLRETALWIKTKLQA
ncbi:MAG TPA: alpha/beta hydrolase [Dongiaceae bacterium]